MAEKKERNAARAEMQRRLRETGVRRDHKDTVFRMLFKDRGRSYAVELPTAEAVERAVDECIEQGILRDFLLKNKAEVMRMDIFEYDERATRKAIQEFEREEGRREGRREGKEEEREAGMRHLVETCCELHCPRRVALEKLAEKYGLTGEEAEARMHKYWREQDT